MREDRDGTPTPQTDNQRAVGCILTGLVVAFVVSVGAANFYLNVHREWFARFDNLVVGLLVVVVVLGVAVAGLTALTRRGRVRTSPCEASRAPTGQGPEGTPPP